MTDANSSNLFWNIYIPWSQITLPPYDFSDLQVTGEFENRSVTGRFSLSFPCVVTNRPDAGRRLYITIADARVYKYNHTNIFISMHIKLHTFHKEDRRLFESNRYQPSESRVCSRRLHSPRHQYLAHLAPSLKIRVL